MSKGINLLGAEQRISVKIGSRKLKLLRAAGVWLLFGISAASIALFLLIALSPLPTLQKQEQDALNKLSAYHPDVAKLLLVEDRLKGSEAILAKRTDFDLTLDKIKEKMPEGASITGLKMDSKEISVTVTSSSLASLDTFLNNLIAAVEAKEDFSKITLTRFLSSGVNTTYTLTITVVTL